MKQEFVNDWLGSDPVFYNERTGKASRNINEVIDFGNVALDPEGFNNYLKFGYSVFGQTPVQHVKFLPPSSRLLVDDQQKKLCLEELPDEVENLLASQTDEAQLLELLTAHVQNWESTVTGEIVVPTSGGYDSRLLNLLLKDKSRIRAYTYGISENQSRSYEVFFARKTADALGFQWEQIPLGDFHSYFDSWEDLFGVSTHAHGMYHFEFFRKILEKVSPQRPLLSGIIGDAWSGKVKIGPIQTPADVADLGYSHGLQAEVKFSQLSSRNDLTEAYFEKKKGLLLDENYRVVESMRFKIILLCYLMRLPRSLGFQPWSPFLVKEIALGMLTLPAARKQDRKWQRELFQQHGLDFESQNHQSKASFQNTLDKQGLKKMPVQPLDVSVLRECIQPTYVSWINSKLRKDHGLNDMIQWVAARPKGPGLLRVLGIPDQTLMAYNAYLVLKPIETLLKKRI